MSPLALLITLAAVVYLAAGAVTIDGYQNNWGGSVDFHCWYGQAINRVYSVFTNNDRRWRLKCGKPSEEAGYKPYSCTWHNKVNDPDKPLIFMCPENQIVVGMKSEYRRYNKDRISSFQCCKATDDNLKTVGCEMTPYINEFRKPMDYTVPKGKVIIGWFSLHQNKYEDRINKVVTCDFKKV